LSSLHGYAFLFVEDALKALEEADENLFRVVLESDEKKQVGFEFRRGGLLLYTLAYRATSISAEPSVPGERFRRGASVTQTGDKDLYLTLVYDFCDAFRWEWHTEVLPAAKLPLVIARENIHVLSVSAIERSLAEAIDAAERATPGYIGAVVVDPGNPIAYYVLWSALSHGFDYVQGSLKHWQSHYEPEERWDLTGDNWWNRLGFTSVDWTSPGERSVDLPTLSSAPESLRGSFSRALLETRGKPNLQEKVVDALRQQLGPTSQFTVPVKFEASQLPGAGVPEVEDRKLTAYALNPKHERGKDKALLFDKLLGLGLGDAKHLAAQLRAGLPGAEIDRVEFTPYGVKYCAIIPIQGANGRALPVQTAWEIRPGGHPRLVTCYPAEPGTVVSQTPIERPSLVDTSASTVDWNEIWDRALSAARTAAERAIPTPLVVEDAWYSEGGIGFAWIRVLDARKGFARWLKTTGKGRDGHRSGAYVFAQQTGQSFDRSMAWASAFAEVLRDHGIRCEVEGRYD
jgi:hypothetical protein